MSFMIRYFLSFRLSYYLVEVEERRKRDYMQRNWVKIHFQLMNTAIVAISKH